MKLTSLYCVLMILLCIQIGHSQIYIQGTVRNQQKQGIAYASLKVLNTTMGTSTNKKGEYKLQLPAQNAMIEISALGYATKVVQLKTTTLNIVLQKSTETLDEVVVAAQKREELLRETPVAVTHINSKTVEATRLWGLSGLTAIVPNYLYQELGVGFQQVQAIRGIQVFSENPAVATYIDDVNNLDILANGFALTDIERIEILRGPQGTLFGRNAMGGVVNITTKKPSNTTQGFVELGFGNLNLNRHSVAIKTPVIKDKLFFGFSGLFQDREGYWKNDDEFANVPDASLNGQTVGDERNLYGNVFLKWLISDRWSATVNVKAQRDWSNASGFFVSQPNKEVAFQDPDKIYLSRLGNHERNITNTSLVFKYSTPQIGIISISTYQNIVLAFEDIDFPGFFHSFTNNEIGEDLNPQEVWTQEFRIHSKQTDSRIQYTAGVFGFSQVLYEPSTNLAFELDQDTFSIFKNKGENYGYAAFGELEYSFTTSLKATVGFRYDFENRKNTFNEFNDLVFDGEELIQNSADISKDGTYEAISPKFAFSYQLNPNSNVYASYTRGFRAGGINAQGLPTEDAQTFDPEFSNNFEVGYKASALNNKLNLAVAAYFISWEDLQFFNLVTPVVATRENVGDAQSAGLELEATAIPFKGLQLEANVGITDTEYKNFELSRLANFETSEISITPIGGNRLSNTPTHTLFTAAQYTIPVSKNARASLRGEIRNIGSYYTDIQNQLEQPSYTIINAQASIHMGKYQISAWGQNMTDQTYLAFGSADTSSGNRQVRTAAPRTYGISFKIDF
ncbi:TonB-dependent receptor [Aquimarina sp. U1-2]|uniref:TonB-dependent receptor n=1 Tax=Aquimarina sp. U1-2 TaxID=2823141 RepID=UPI001AECFACE|nr:TonB-dependent receptor [Aquimarina sp. U1-2]MBP2833403.1 TonB-dependent receptor [Aquimarina sp. U1-2]